MTNVELLVDPTMITLTGSEQTLPAGVKAIKPISCKITSLKKNAVNGVPDTTNYASSFAALTLTGTGDNYTPICCGGFNRFYEKMTGTAAGTLYIYK